ncbi:hypothetical protein K440DRAFT_661642 [Wilcoxina mikolae CBS 423.85]|nr:hypothetical protein K440DRAFT_661642 [Wilcoxina mikolae CBS 423.85]
MSTGIPNFGNTKPPSDPTPTSTGRRPSQVHGHAKYAKGVVNETIGQMTNSPSWQASGAENKAAGIAEMRAAKEVVDKDLRENYQTRDPQRLKTEGKSQNALGKTVGCQGMVERGGEKVETGETLGRS